MTIRGSAVQEDASSGIWELTEASNGLKLSIGRAKGKGRGNYRLFEIKKVDLEGVDAYKDPLEGIVVVNKGGTEDERTSDHIEKQMNIRRAWAKAIVGALAIWPLENPDSPLKCSNNPSNIAKFLTTMWVNRDSDYEAAGFVGDWMDQINKYDEMITVTGENQWKKADTAIKANLSDNQSLVIGEYKVIVEKQSGGNKIQFTVKPANQNNEQ
jgi:hypothetical protein